LRAICNQLDDIDNDLIADNEVSCGENSSDLNDSQYHKSTEDNRDSDNDSMTDNYENMYDNNIPLL